MKRLFRTKNIIIVLLSLIVLPTIQNCERDDICAESTSTTPRLIIEFYDADNTDDLKNVPRLTVYGDSPDIPIPDNDDFSSAILVDPLVEPVEYEYIFNTNENTVSLPLLIGTEGDPTTTRFVLEKDTNLRLDDIFPETSNLDIIEISYTPEFVYVSRACGYKNIFNDLVITEDDDLDPWISSIEIVETTIENENTVHVRIFH